MNAETMQAVLVDAPGGPEHLRLGEHPRPIPAAGELLVRVRATALNRADLMQREGKYPPPEGATPILGLEMAGTVEAVGADVPAWKEGDRVCALLDGGGYAECVAIPHPMAMPVPDGLSLEEAAAIPEVFLTAFQALHWIGQMEAGDNALIHAGASGVGTAAIQLVRAAGGRPMVTASGGKLHRCRALGADVAIDYRQEDFAERVLEATGGHGADVILDFIGAPYFEQNIKTLALDGRLVLLAMLGGSRLDGLDLRKLFKKRARFFHLDAPLSLPRLQNPPHPRFRPKSPASVRRWHAPPDYRPGVRLGGRPGCARADGGQSEHRQDRAAGRLSGFGSDVPGFAFLLP